MGHSASLCRTPWEKIRDKKELPPDKGNPPESAHYVVAHCNLGIEEIFSTSFSSWNDIWLLDTGATCHTTFRKDFFETFNDKVDGVVYFANRSQLKPLGIGSVRLKLPRLEDYILSNVLYLPQFKRNLISLVHIRQQGHSIHMYDGIIEIKRASDRVIIMTGVEEDKLLKLKGTSSTSHHIAHLVQHSGNLSSSLLWHARFGHISYDSLKLLKRNGVQGLPTIPRQLSPCDACILGKHSKQPFHDSMFRASRKLGLIHSDLCGPMSVPSANGNKYLMTFIDDYTRMCWVYLLKDKSQVFSTFRNFHLWIKNETQLNIGTLRTDNGGEYTSHEFKKYLLDNGIKHQTTVPYNPQQNGVVERMNRTILNIVRFMMFFNNVKLMFWGEAVLCAIYINNRSPSAALHNKTPYEVWHGHLPTVKHFKVFGSTCYALVPTQLRNKLGARSRKCLFL